jgi:sulfoxide reductase heme-binding subunit YedZ
MLHRLVYVTAICGVIHYLWLVKLDLRPPQRYAVLVGALLAVRLVWVRWRTTVPARAQAPSRT